MGPFVDLNSKMAKPLLYMSPPPINLKRISLSVGWTPLHLACEFLRKDTLELLLYHEADCNILNKDGWSPVHTASEYSTSEMLKSLVLRGGNINARNKNGWTPLHLASVYSNIDLVRTVLELGGDINARNENQETPLQLAREFKSPDVIIILAKNEKESSKMQKHAWIRNVKSFFSI